MALGDVMQWTRGWSATETVEAYTQARVVTERSGGADSIKILAQLCRSANLRGEPRAALALADQMLAIAHRSGSRLALVTAQYAQALPRHILGDLAGARQLYGQVMDYYREEDFSDNSLPDRLSSRASPGTAYSQSGRRRAEARRSQDRQETEVATKMLMYDDAQLRPRSDRLILAF